MPTPFPKRFTRGVSANLCEALVDLIEPFPALDISITWARTFQMSTPRQTVSFTGDDVPILRAAVPNHSVAGSRNRMCD